MIYAFGILWNDFYFTFGARQIFHSMCFITAPFLITSKHLLPNVRKVFFAESIIQLVL